MITWELIINILKEKHRVNFIFTPFSSEKV